MTPPPSSRSQSSRRLQRQNGSLRLRSRRSQVSTRNQSGVSDPVLRRNSTVSGYSCRPATRSTSTSVQIPSPSNNNPRPIRLRRPTNSHSIESHTELSNNSFPLPSTEGLGTATTSNPVQRKRRTSSRESSRLVSSSSARQGDNEDNVTTLLPRKRSKIQVSEQSLPRTSSFLELDAALSDDSSDGSPEPSQLPTGASRYPLRSLVRRQERRDYLERQSSFTGRSLDTLPFEVCQHVYQYLSIKELYRIRMLCHRLQISVDLHLWTLKRINFCNGLPFLYLPDQITDRVLFDIVRRSPQVTHILGFYPRYISYSIINASPSQQQISNTALTYPGVFHAFRHLNRLRSIEIMDISILSKIGNNMEVKFHGMFRNRPDLWDQQLVYTPYMHFTDGSLADTSRASITSPHFVTITPPAQPFGTAPMGFGTINPPFGGNGERFQTARMSTGGRPRLQAGNPPHGGTVMTRFVMPHSLVNVTKLEFVSTCLSSLPRMDSLKYLSLRCVRFTSTTPFNNLQMPKLQTFIMNNCTVGNRNTRHLRILPELAKASQLTRMEISSCRLLVSLVETMITDNAQHLGFTPFSRLTRLVLAGLRDISPREVGLMMLAAHQSLQHVALEASCLSNAELLALANANVQISKLEYLCLGYEDPLRQRLSQRELKQLELTNNGILMQDLNLPFDRSFPFPMRLCIPPPGSSNDQRGSSADQLNGLLNIPQQANIGNAFAAVVQQIQNNQVGEEGAGNGWGAFRAPPAAPAFGIPPRVRSAWTHSNVSTTHPMGHISDIGLSAILLVSPQLQTLHVSNQPFLRHLPMWHPRYAHRLRCRPALHNRIAPNFSSNDRSGLMQNEVDYVSPISLYASDLRREGLLDDLWGINGSHRTLHMLPDNNAHSDYSLPRCLREASSIQDAQGVAKAFPPIRTLILERCPGIVLTSFEAICAHYMMPNLETVILREMFPARPLVEVSFGPPSLHSVFASSGETKVASDTHNRTVRPPLTHTFDMGIEDRGFSPSVPSERWEQALQDARLHQLDVWRHQQHVTRSPIILGIHRPGWHDLADTLNDVRCELIRWRPEYCQMPLIPSGSNPPMGNLWDIHDDDGSSPQCPQVNQSTATKGESRILGMPEIMTVGRGEYRLCMVQSSTNVSGLSSTEACYNSAWDHYRHPTREALAHRVIAEALKRANSANSQSCQKYSSGSLCGSLTNAGNALHSSHDSYANAYMYCDFQSRATQTCLCHSLFISKKRENPLIKESELSCRLCRSDICPPLVEAFHGYPEPLIVPKRFEKDVIVRDACVDTRERALHAQIPMYHPLHITRASNLTTLHLEQVGITHLWLEQLPKLRNLTLLSCPQLQGVLPEFADNNNGSDSSVGLSNRSSNWSWKDDGDGQFQPFDFSNSSGPLSSGSNLNQRCEISTNFWPNLRRVRIIRCPRFGVRQLLHLLIRMRYDRKDNMFIIYRPFGHYDKFTEDILWLNIHMQAACNMNLCISHDYARHLSERQMESRRTRIEAYLREAVGFEERHQNSQNSSLLSSLTYSGGSHSFVSSNPVLNGSQMRVPSLFSGTTLAPTPSALPTMPSSFISEHATAETLLLNNRRMSEFGSVSEDPFLGGPWMRLSGGTEIPHRTESGTASGIGEFNGSCLYPNSSGCVTSTHESMTRSNMQFAGFGSSMTSSATNTSNIRRPVVENQHPLHIGHSTSAFLSACNNGRCVFSPPFLNNTLPPIFPTINPISAHHNCFSPIQSMSATTQLGQPLRTRHGLHKVAGVDWELTHELNWPSESLAEDLDRHGGNIINHSVSDSQSPDSAQEEEEEEAPPTTSRRKCMENAKLEDSDYQYFLDNLCSESQTDVTPLHYAPFSSTMFPRPRILHLHVQWRDVHPVDYLPHPYHPLTAPSSNMSSSQSIKSKHMQQCDSLNDRNARHVDEAYLIPPLQQFSQSLNPPVIRALRGNKWILDRMSDRVRKVQESITQYQEMCRLLQRQSEERQRLQSHSHHWTRRGRESRRTSSAALMATIARVKMEDSDTSEPIIDDEITGRLIIDNSNEVNHALLGLSTHCTSGSLDDSSNGAASHCLVVNNGGVDVLPGPPSPRFNLGVRDSSPVPVPPSIRVDDNDDEENSQSSSRSPSECQVEFSHGGIGIDENTNF